MTLILFSEVNDKPHELTVLAMVRAKMCEMLSRAIGEEQPEAYFLVGLLSVLDALMDMAMEDIVAALPLSDEIMLALLEHNGKLGQILRCALAYERAEWDEIARLDCDPILVKESYLSAIHWANLFGKAFNP